MTAWIDPVVEAHGFEPRSPYVEGAWLPVLGPASVLLYRRLGALVQACADPVDIDVVDLALSVGLGAGVGGHAPLTRTLNRLVAFGVIRPAGDAGYEVRRALAPLTVRQAMQLPATARQFHEQCVLSRSRPNVVTGAVQ